MLGPCSLAAAASFASVAGLGVAAEPFDALEEAVDAGLLRWDGQRGLRFGHPLLGASVLAGLGAGPARAGAPRGGGAGGRRGDRAPAPRGGRRGAGRCAGRGLRGLRRALGGAAARGGDGADHRQPAERRRAASATRGCCGRSTGCCWPAISRWRAPTSTRSRRRRPGARRDSTLAGFALTSGDVEGAAPLLAAAWSGCDPAADPELAALIAHRNAFHALVNLRDDAVVAWTARAEGLSPDALLGVEWIAMHALALWRLGRRSEAYALLESAAGAGGDAVAQLRGKRGWLRCADDDLGPRPRGSGGGRRGRAAPRCVEHRRHPPDDAGPRALRRGRVGGRGRRRRARGRDLLRARARPGPRLRVVGRGRGARPRAATGRRPTRTPRAARPSRSTPPTAWSPPAWPRRCPRSRAATRRR